MSEMLLYHGSDHIIRRPEFGRGKSYNDYGAGFYCTESLEMAKEWACYGAGKDGYANAYRIDIDGLSELDLLSEEYTLLNWLAVLLEHRSFPLAFPAAQRAKEYLLENFRVETAGFDLIRGYRADDSYFSFAKDFLNNAISLGQLQRAMMLGKLGEQVMIQSEDAFQRLKYCEEDSRFADSSIYFPRRIMRDQKARTDYLSEERLQTDEKGLFVREILREGMKNDDFK